MRSPDQRMLNAVQHPERYREVVLLSGGFPVVLSVWAGSVGEPAVLFIPGTATHPLLYEDLLDELNAAGLTVVGLHLAGHGKSPRLRRRLTFDLLVTNVLDALVWAQNAFPRAPRVLLGTSQGSILAMAAAARTDGLERVVLHNVLAPGLADSLLVTRAPAWWRPAHTVVRRGLQALERLAPGMPVPVWAYLDPTRVSRDPGVIERFDTDPLGRRSYPLAVLAGMVQVDAAAPIGCPVTVLTAAGDRLFSLEYTRAAFELIQAPDKELAVIDAGEHMILTEALELVLPVLVPLLSSVREPAQA
jgi:alpha-beta hydrolase superfamily lysophospholipase